MVRCFFSLYYVPLYRVCFVDQYIYTSWLSAADSLRLSECCHSIPVQILTISLWQMSYACMKLNCVKVQVMWWLACMWLRLQYFWTALWAAINIVCEYVAVNIQCAAIFAWIITVKCSTGKECKKICCKVHITTLSTSHF